MTTNPYTPRPWQLPHLLAAPIGGTVLLVERCERQPPMGFGDLSPKVLHGVWKMQNAYGGLWTAGDCPLGPVGTVLRIEGVGDFRTTAIDLRQFETMTEEEAGSWGTDTLKMKHFGQWLIDTNNADPSNWSWFVTAERVERA